MASRQASRILVLMAVLSAALGLVPSGRRPLSHILADTAFLADAVRESPGEDWKSSVSSYLSLVERTVAEADGVEAGTRAKRQLPTDVVQTLTEDPDGLFLLKTMVPRFNVPARFPNDVVLFSRLEAGAPVWYAVALEADDLGPQVSQANALVLYKLMGNQFLRQHRVETRGASSLAVHEVQGWVYVVAAERLAASRGTPLGGPILYRLSTDGRSLVSVHTLQSHNPSDLCFWEFNGEHYLAVTTEFSSNSSSFSAETLVYLWMGEHLDVVQRLPSSGAKSVAAFAINSNQYLAVVNYINDQGETNIDSVVYRFDSAKGRFAVHQKLRTNAGVDVSFFSMNSKRGTDHFLVVVNNYHDSDRTRYIDTKSVIFKWEEGYFVPFQSLALPGVQQWTPYSGRQGETALLGFGVYGLHIFQYNGWRFQQLSIRGIPILVGADARLSSLRAAVFGSDGLIAVASKQNDGTQPNVYSLEFQREEPLGQWNDRLRGWCDRERARLDRDSAAALLERVAAAPTWNSDVVVVDSVTFKSKSYVNLLVVNASRSQTSDAERVFVERVNTMAAGLAEAKQGMASAQDIMGRALKVNGHNVVKGRVVMQSASVACPGGCRFGRANVRLLNAEDAVNWSKHWVRLDANINAGKLQFTSLVVPGNVVAQKVLGRTEALVNRVNTKHLLGSLFVEELTVAAGLHVNGTIDGTRISREHVLLRAGDQRLQGATTTSNWEVQKLILHGHVNGMLLDLSRPQLPPDVVSAPLPLSLAVENVHLDGLFGSVDIREVERRALRSRGDQTVTGEHFFASLHADGVNTSALSLEDVVRIDREEKVPQMLVFSKPLAARHVQVFHALNHVAAASDGSLDLLLQGGLAGAQSVTGKKWVRTLEVTDEARVRGSVLGLVMPTEGVRRVVEETVINGTVIIMGQVTVTGKVVAADITEGGSSFSVMSVLKDAVRLDEPLPPTVVIKNLEVDNVDVEVVNGERVDRWIPDSDAAHVYVEQPVTFDGDVLVTGQSTLTTLVNGVSLVELRDTSLMTTGDQVVSGIKTFHVVVSGSVHSNETVLGKTPWRDVAAMRGPRAGVFNVTQNLVLGGPLTAKRLKTLGTLGGIDVNAALDDAVFSDAVNVILGQKTFAKPIVVRHLVVSENVSGANLTGVLLASQRVAPEPGDELIFPATASPYYIRRALAATRLNFEGTLDGMGHGDWSAPWLETDGDQTLHGPQTVLGVVHALSGVRVATTVNGADLKRFASQVATVDDPDLRLGSVTFDSVVALDAVTADSVVGVNLTDALLARGALVQPVDGRWTLLAGLEAESLTTESLAGENFTSLCAFANPTAASLNTPQHMTVEGNVLMESEPVKVINVNGMSMQKLQQNTWFKNRATKITAFMNFGDLSFADTVIVKGEIDGVDLRFLADNYVSLNADSAIFAELHVKEGIVATRNVRSPGPIDVQGRVNGFYLRELASRVMLNGVDQHVVGHMTFDTVDARGDFVLDGTVNGLDLAKDIARFLPSINETLQHNVLRKPLTVRGSLHVAGDIGPDDCGRTDCVLVQGVNLRDWYEKAVRVDGEYVINGTVVLRSPSVGGGLWVGGLIGGVRVAADNLLLRHVDQVVLGAKTLSPWPLTGRAPRVQRLSLAPSRLVNGVDMRGLLAGQAYKLGNVVVDGPARMAARALSGYAARVEALYQGVNVSELVHEAIYRPRLDHLDEHHERLLAVADFVKQSLHFQGYYLNYYHTAVVLRAGVRAVLPLGKAGDGAEPDDPVHAVAVVREASPSHDLVLDFFAWDSDRGTLVAHPTIRPASLSLPSTVRIVQHAGWSGQNAIYWEMDGPTGVRYGHVLGVLRDGQLGVAQVLHDSLGGNAWVTVASLLGAGGANCLIRGSPGTFLGTDGFCAAHCIGVGRVAFSTQSLPVHRPMHAAALSAGGLHHVFVASGASEASEGGVSVWRWEAATQSLRQVQSWIVANATAVAATEHNGIPYLATASGHVEGAPHRGLVHISRFDKHLGYFTHWHSLEVDGPLSLEFAVLPSGELMLYVATECPTHSLVVFKYRGVAGFVRQVSAAVPASGALSAFTTLDYQHVVAVASGESRGLGGGQAALLQAAFKGSWQGSESAFRFRGYV